jgi:hypothetical protein
MTTETTTPTTTETPTPPPPSSSTPPNGSAPPPATPDPNAPPADPNAPPAKPGKTANDRIQEITAERNAAMDYATYWRNEAIALRDQGGEGAAPKEPAEKPRPKLSDFEGDDRNEKWSEALAEWTEDRIARGIETGVEKKTTEAKATQERADAIQAHNTRVAKFAEAHPDYAQTMRNPGLNISKTMADCIVESDLGPEIAYYLGQNVPESVRIARLSPTKAAAAIGRLEAKLEAEAAAGTPPPPAPGTPPDPASTSPTNALPAPETTGHPTPKTTSAPPPPSPVTTTTTPELDLETCSLEAYLDHRLKRKRRR